MQANKKALLCGVLVLGAIAILALFLWLGQTRHGQQNILHGQIDDLSQKDIAAYRQALTHDAYIWQRVWTSALADAVQEATPAIKQWRVLAAQASSDTQLKHFEPQWVVLAQSKRPVVLVVRIDGQLQNFDQQAMLEQIGRLYTYWRDRCAEYGITIIGVEIDYDCATRRLSAYAEFLQHLRAHLFTLSQNKAVQISITALPDWLNAQELDAVLASVDYSVLQIHSVLEPAQGGLFNSRAAQKWVLAYNQRCVKKNKPFLMALPNYGSRVNWDRNGRIATVISEAPLNGGIDIKGYSQELSADPQEIFAFLLTALNYQTLPQLKGVAWFRLPTVQDERVWAIPTWLSVIRAETLKSDVQAFLIASPQDDAFYRVILQNKGSADVVQPAHISLPSVCSYADSVRANGYSLQQQTESHSNNRFFQREDQGLLRAGQSKEIGWARCEAGINLRLQLQDN